LSPAQSASASNKYQDPDPDPHQSDKLDPESDPDPLNLQMTSQNVWNMSLFEHPRGTPASGRHGHDPQNNQQKRWAGSVAVVRHDSRWGESDSKHGKPSQPENAW
jgi:hypothetical protein